MGTVTLDVTADPQLSLRVEAQPAVRPCHGVFEFAGHRAATGAPRPIQVSNNLEVRRSLGFGNLETRDPPSTVTAQH